MVKATLLSIAFLFAQNSLAKTFMLGTVWPVKEKNMAVLLKQKAESINTESIKEHWMARAKQYYARPTSVQLPRATQFRRHKYTPIASSQQDIVDNAGRVIVQGNTRINVLESLPFYYPELYFFNADDSLQLKFIQHLKPKSQTKLILVKGSVVKTEKLLHQKIYFDQQGILCKTFGITQVPAHVFRDKNLLLIDEININGKEK